MRAFIIVIALFVSSFAQPPGGGAGPGQTSASTCSGHLPSQCAVSGGSKYVNWGSTQTLTFDSNGRATVSFTSNSCPSGANANLVSGSSTNVGLASPTCLATALPATAYSSSSALAAPLRGAVGYTLWGVNIYGPMDAGFSNGQVCSGTCTAGTDLTICGASLEYQCGTANVKNYMLLDDCGGHASPYHYHTNINCDYSQSQTGHSPIIGFGLDGRGLYGRYESTTTVPTDLDACGGHNGSTPASSFTDSEGHIVTIPAQTNHYHYHIIDGGPTTISCYGPVASVTAAKALYSTCGAGYTTCCTSLGSITYDLDCPIYNQESGGALYNYGYANTSSCTACKGNCAGAGSGAACNPASATGVSTLILGAAVIAAASVLWL